MKKIYLITLLLTLLIIPSQSQTKNAVNINYGKFGFINSLLNASLSEYPNISGDGIGIKIKKYGDDGVKSTFYSVYSLRIFEYRAGGFWRANADDYRIKGFFKMKQVDFTYSAILNLIPSFRVTPYIGIGIGVGIAILNAEADYRDKWQEHNDLYNYQALIPIVKLPVGLSIRVNNEIEVEIEGGFENGFYISWGISYNF